MNVTSIVPTGANATGHQRPFEVARAIASSLVGPFDDNAVEVIDTSLHALGEAYGAHAVELWVSTGNDVRRLSRWHQAETPSRPERRVISLTNFPTWATTLERNECAVVGEADLDNAVQHDAVHPDPDTAHDPDTDLSSSVSEFPTSLRHCLLLPFGGGARPSTESPIASLRSGSPETPLNTATASAGLLIMVRPSSQPWSSEEVDAAEFVAELVGPFLSRVEHFGRLLAAFEAAPSAMTVRDQHGVLLDCNQSFIDMLGSDGRDHLLGSSIVEVIDLAEAQRSSIDWGGDQTSAALDIPYLRADGTTVWGRTITASVDRNGAQYAVSHIHDITATRVVESRLNYEANHDELTGLLNRRALMGVLEDSTANDEPVTVLLIDLDGFKVTNDSLGHDTGDELLKAVADRLRRVIRPSDIVARLGGDEFVVVLPSADLVAGTDVAQRVLEALRLPVRLGGNDVFTGASIGIAHTEDDERSAGALLRKADIAMYAAKGQGKNCFEAFDKNHKAAFAARQAIETDLRKAAHNQSLEVYYQPIYHLESGRLTGAEALVRWRGEGDVLIDANKFIDVAREVGVLGELGEAALEAACISGTKWAIGRDPSEFTLRVNIGAAQLGRHGMVPLVRRVLECTKFPAQNLCLEVSEDALMRDPDRAQETLEALSQLGVQLCVDSFGQGLGSILQLRRFSIHMLKIAPEIVWGVDEDPDYLSIAEMIMLLANSMDLDVVADGIETKEQLRTMIALGVPQGQGYQLDVPLPARELTELIALHKSRELLSAGDLEAEARPVIEGMHLDLSETADQTAADDKLVDTLAPSANNKLPL